MCHERQRLHTLASRWSISRAYLVSPPPPLLPPLPPGPSSPSPSPVSYSFPSPALVFALRLGNSTSTASESWGIPSGSNLTYLSSASVVGGGGAAAGELPTPTPNSTCTGARPVQPALRYPSSTARVSMPASRKYHWVVGTSAARLPLGRISSTPTSLPSSSATSAESRTKREMSSVNRVCPTPISIPGPARCVSSSCGIPCRSSVPPAPSDESPLPMPAPSLKPEIPPPCATGGRSFARLTPRGRAGTPRPGLTHISQV